MAIHFEKIKRKHYRGALDMSHFEISGFSMGAQIGSHVCRYVSYRSKGGKVKFLLGTKSNNITHTKFKSVNSFIDYYYFKIGIDPAGIPHLLSQSNRIQSGDAEYVQIIHTSTIMGTIRSSADDDIYIKSTCENVVDPEESWFYKKVLSMFTRSLEKHRLGLKLFFAICTEHIRIIADSKGFLFNINIFSRKPKAIHYNPKEDSRNPNATQIEVGVYYFDPDRKQRIFELSMVKEEANIDNIMKNAFNIPRYGF